jgi:hypothetical protein
MADSSSSSGVPSGITTRTKNAPNYQGNLDLKNREEMVPMEIMTLPSTVGRMTKGAKTRINTSMIVSINSEP